jgi:glycyl-tRNA synthetase (class II)
MFEHSFYTRGGPAAASASDGADADARGVFRFAPVVAPIKATVFPLLQKADLNEVRTGSCQQMWAVVGR